MCVYLSYLHFQCAHVCFDIFFYVHMRVCLCEWFTECICIQYFIDVCVTFYLCMCILQWLYICVCEYISGLSLCRYVCVFSLHSHFIVCVSMSLFESVCVCVLIEKAINMANKWKGSNTKKTKAEKVGVKNKQMMKY